MAQYMTAGRFSSGAAPTREPTTTGMAQQRKKQKQTKETPAPKSPVQLGTTQAAQTAASGGSTSEIASSALLASGNPYAMGAGLGLATISAIRKKNQQEKQQSALMENQRRQRQVQALQSLVSTARGLSL